MTAAERLHALGLGLVGLTLGQARANACDAVDSAVYARCSTTMFFASELSPLPTISGRIGAEGGVRLHRRHVALEARLGMTGSFTTSVGGLELGYRAGASVGWAFALGSRVVTEPMLAYDVFAIADELTIVVQRATVEVPVSILLYPHVVLEPYMQVGVSRTHGVSDLVLVIGPRLGVVF